MTETQDKLGLVERRSPDGRVTLLAAPPLLDAAVAGGLLCDVALADLAGSSVTAHAGRGRPVRLELAGVAVIAKTLRRGGLFGRFFADRFVGGRRLLETVSLLLELENAGAPTMPFAFARLRRAGGPLLRLDLATRELPAARDGCELLSGPVPVAALRAALVAAAQAIRQLHAAGVDHADLNVRNLLFSADEPPRAFVIDLEKSRLRAALPPIAAVANLARLLRSAEKLGLIGSRLAAHDLALFTKSYLETARGEPGHASTLPLELWSAVRTRYRRLAPFHRAGWRLLRGGPAVRSCSPCPDSPASCPTNRATTRSP